MATGFCELCGPPNKAEYIVYVVSRNGRRDERRLCEVCAENAERILFGSARLPLTDLLTTLVTERPIVESEENRTKVCPSCGNSVDGVKEAGVMGCCECYSVFRAEAISMIEKWHGYTVGSG